MHNHLNFPFERNHHQYPADHIYAFKPTHQFQGRITKSEDDLQKSVRVIDGAVVIESVDERTRAAALDHFSRLQEMASFNGERHTSSYYKGIAATFLGAGITLSSVILLPAPYLIGAAAGAALSGLGIWSTVYNHGAIKTIDEEIDTIESKMGEWEDPVEEVIAHRKQTGSQGFQYVYVNELKGKVVHQEEVKELWIRDFSKLLGGRQSIEQMSKDNLLGDECIVFAWNQVNLPDLEVAGYRFSALELDALSKQFKTCRTNFLNFETAIRNELSALEKQESQFKHEIKNLRNQWLYPAECLHAQSRQEAEYLYESALSPFIHERNNAIEKVKHDYHCARRNPFDACDIAYNQQLERLCEQEIQSIRLHYSTHPAVVSIERAYENDRCKCDFLLRQSQLVVHSFFDARLNSLKNSVNEAKNKIEEQRKAGHQNFKTVMDSILSNVGKTNIMIPVLPTSVERVWSLPTSLTNEPAWNEVYGRVPTFHSDFNQNISELGWNMFWSQQGLGRFASCPSSSWRQLSRDRMAFPFRQQWFNLQTTPVKHNNGMFMRHVNIPAFTGSSNIPHVVPGTRGPVNTQSATGHAGTMPREEVRVAPGTRAPASGFATTTRKEETHVVPGTRAPGQGFANTVNR